MHLNILVKLWSQKYSGSIFFNRVWWLKRTEPFFFIKEQLTLNYTCSLSLIKPRNQIPSVTVFFTGYIKVLSFYSCFSFAQGAVIAHFVILAVLWITRDLGGAGGWGRIFPPKYVFIKLLNDWHIFSNHSFTNLMFIRSLKLTFWIWWTVFHFRLFPLKFVRNVSL